MFRSGIIQAATYGVSLALMKGISLLMLPYVSSVLTPAEYGRLEVLASLAAFVSVIVGLGLQEALFRQVGQADGERQKTAVVRRIYALACVTTGVALCAAVLGAQAVASALPGDLGEYEVRLILIGLSFEGSIAIPLAWLRIRERAVTFATLTLLRAVFQALLTVLMLESGRGLAGVLEASLIATCVQALVLTRMQMQATGARLELRRYRILLCWALPVVGSGLLAFCLNGLDRWLLAAWHGVEQVALYGIAGKFALAAVLLMQPFGMWWAPRRFAVLKGEDGARRVVRVVNVGVMAVFAVALLVAFSAPVLIEWLMPPHYLEAGRIVVLLVCVMTIREVTELLSIGCYAGEDTRGQLFVNLFATLFGVGAMWLLVPDHGILGVVSALLLTYALRLLALTAVGQRVVRIPFPFVRYFVLAALVTPWLVLAGEFVSLATSIGHLSAALASLVAGGVMLGLVHFRPARPGLAIHGRVTA